MGKEKLSDTMPKKILHLLGIPHLLSTFKYSFAGLSSCFKSEVAFRQEVVGAIVNLIAVFVLPLSFSIRWMMISLSILVLCLELVNTGVEAVVDLVTLDRHPLAKKAKDVCSAAIFLSLTLFFVSWGVIIAKLCNFGF